MNKSDRKILADIRDNLTLQKQELETLKEELDDRVANIQEYFISGTPNTEIMEEESFALDDAMNSMDEVISQIENLLDGVMG